MFTIWFMKYIYKKLFTSLLSIRGNVWKIPCWRFEFCASAPSASQYFPRRGRRAAVVMQIVHQR